MSKEKLGVRGPYRLRYLNTIAEKSLSWVQLKSGETVARVMLESHLLTTKTQSRQKQITLPLGVEGMKTVFSLNILYLASSVGLVASRISHHPYQPANYGLEIAKRDINSNCHPKPILIL